MTQAGCQRLQIALATLACCLCALPARSAHSADEDGLKKVWDQHTSAPDDHAEVVAACRAFSAANPGDPLVPVAQSIEAWHLLHQGNREAATAILEGHLATRDGPVGEGAAEIARAWLTRTDRDSVVRALQLYYRKEVGYPESLDAIVSHPKIPQAEHPPLADRFGAPWRYSLAGLKVPAKFADQRYELGSASLGNSAELAKALELPYAAAIDARPTKVWDDRDPPMAQLNFTAGASAMPAGKTERGILLAFIGEKIIVVSNREHWKIFSRP